MVNSRLTSDPNFFIREVVNNNTNDVFENLKKIGYKGTKEPEDVIASIKQLVALGDKKEALNCLNVQLVENKVSSSLRKELEIIANYRKKNKK